jgi:hypothetical protein
MTEPEPEVLARRASKIALRFRLKLPDPFSRATLTAYLSLL